jgi:hypothetical protein
MTAPPLPTYLAPATIDRLRARDESAMRDTCDIHRQLPGGTNPDNSPAHGSEQIIPGIKCRFTLRLFRAEETLLAFGISGEVHGFMRVPVGTDVNVSDLISYKGNQYEIVGSNAARTFNTSIQLALRLVQ